MNATQIEPILMTDSQASQYLGVSTRHLLELRKRGELPYVMIGNRHFRYRASDLNEWAKRKAAESVTRSK